MKLCQYGCGKEAIYQFKNGTLCCSKYANSCPTKRKINSEVHKGQICSDETKLKMSKAGKGRPSHRKGKTLPKETCKKMSFSRLKEKNPSWKGGSISYNHKEAWELFGKDNCEQCDISLIEYKNKINKRFDMHCNSLPKNYPLMEQSNWSCYCRNCHRIIENEITRSQKNDNFKGNIKETNK